MSFLTSKPSRALSNSSRTSASFDAKGMENPLLRLPQVRFCGAVSLTRNLMRSETPGSLSRLIDSNNRSNSKESWRAIIDRNDLW